MKNIPAGFNIAGVAFIETCSCTFLKHTLVATLRHLQLASHISIPDAESLILAAAGCKLVLNNS